MLCTDEPVLLATPQPPVASALVPAGGASVEAAGGEPASWAVCVASDSSRRSRALSQPPSNSDAASAINISPASLVFITSARGVLRGLRLPSV
jgi:hypothetical protein